MFVNILYIIASVAAVVWGADRLTAGASSVARRFNMSEVTIGLTVVAMGTSLPEFFVSMVSALRGVGGMALGNVVGSNVLNTLVIGGAAAMVRPLPVQRISLRRDIPVALIASLITVALCWDNYLSRIDGILLSALFLLYMYIVLSKKEKDTKETNKDAQTVHESLFPQVLKIALGLFLLIGGSNIFVENASMLARQLNMSEAVVGLTIVAGGTSLPELATSLVAAWKGHAGMAIGNVLGSNVFNLLLILSGTTLVCPFVPEGITSIDMALLTGSLLLFWLFTYTRYTLERWEGAVLVSIYVGYIAWLLM